MRRRIATTLFTLALAIPPSLAAAQAEDDWEVEKNPFSKEVIGKWKRILEKDPSDATALRKLIDLYKRHSKVDKLITEYEAELAKKPDSFAFAMILGHLHAGRGEVPKALEYYEKAATAKPGDVTVHLARAELYRQQRKPDDAEKAYQAALPLTKDAKQKKTILRALADLALDRKDIDAARKHFEAYIALDPGDVTARIELADALSKHNLHAESLAEYKTALGKLGSDPARKVDVMARVGGELEALGKLDDAVKIYREAMDLTQKGHYLRKELTERIIDIHRRRQELRTLIAWYEKTWTAGARGHFEWNVLARLYEETGEQDKALDAFRKAVKAAPYELDTQRRLIAALERAGKEEEAIQQFEAVIKVAPGEPRFQLDLAERYERKGDRKKALALAKDIARRFPDDAGVHAALADMYSRWGEEDLALKQHEILVRIEPSDDTHLVNLGDQWFQRGERQKAVDIWKKIATGKTAAGYARLAEVYAEHDMGSDAVDMYEKAIALEPKNPALHRGLAAVYERSRQDDKAVDSWETVMRLTEKDAAQKPLRREARTRIIGILHRQGKIHQRLREWQRKFDASEVEFGYRLVEAFSKLGRYEEAERVLHRILALDDKDLDAQHQLVSVYKNLNKLKEAIALLKQLAADNPGRERDYYTQIAELEQEQRNDEEAILYVQKALEKSPNDAQAQERLAEIYVRRGKPGDFERAVEAYRKAMELAPRNFKLHMALAKLYGGRGGDANLAAAAKIYREVIRRANDEEQIRSAARKAIEIEAFLGTLGELEKEVAPLAFTFSHKAVYRRLIVDLYGRYVDPLLSRARRGDDAARKELARLGEHGLKPLLEALADGSDPAQQKIAIHVLGYLGNKNAAPPLVKFAVEVADESPAKPAPPPPGPRARRPAPAQPGVLTVDTDSINMELRVEALLAAGRLADPRIIPELEKLITHREVALREAATWALGQTRDKKAVEPLLAALKDSRSSVQALACLGLGRTGDKKALDRVAELLRDTGRGVETRAACAYSLGEAQSAAHLQVLIDVATEGNDEVQAKAAWALGRIGDARARGALVKAYFAKKEPVRSVLLAALARLSGAGAPFEVVPEDPQLAQNKIDYRALVRGLGAMPARAGGTAVPLIVLRGLGKDASAGLGRALSQHRDMTLRVLRDLDARDGGLALGDLTAGYDAATAADRAEIDKVLAAVAQELVPTLVTLTEHRDADVRAAAALVLAKTGDARAEERLERMLGDDAATVRTAALTAVERYLATGKPGKPLTAAVARRLTAGAWRERMAAAATLGRLGAGVDTATFKPALTDESPFVREAAARALGQPAHKDAVPLLLDATRDEEAMVRLAAVESLVKLGDRSARTRLDELHQGDPDERVREAADPRN